MAVDMGLQVCEIINLVEPWLSFALSFFPSCPPLFNSTRRLAARPLTFEGGFVDFTPVFSADLVCMISVLGFVDSVCFAEPMC